MMLGSRKTSGFRCKGYTSLRTDNFYGSIDILDSLLEWTARLWSKEFYDFLAYCLP